MSVTEEQISEVRSEIELAFDGLEPPDFGPLLSGPGAPGEDDSPILRELAGSRWTDLDSDYLEERWSHFGYLNPEGYRYYLPALLTRCLDDFDPANKLMHPTYYSLLPGFWRLYRYGEDKRFANRISQFSESQYKAVCSFLGLGFSFHPSYEFMAAQALRWLWTRYEHPAVAQSRSFYERCYDFSYPPAPDPEIADLVNVIEAAFASRPYPGDHDICDPGPGDDEPAEYALEFRGAAWQRLHPRFLQRHYASLSFFTHRAFQYFLPAFLVADLRGPDMDSWTEAQPVYHLTRGLAPNSELAQAQIQSIIKKAMEESQDPEMPAISLESITLPDFDWHEYAVERLSGFHRGEREAIVAYLRHQAAADEYERPVIEEALNSYWLPSLGARS